MYIFNSCCDLDEQKVTQPQRVTLPVTKEQAKVTMLVSYPQAPKQLMNTIAETARLCGERNIGLNDSTLRYLCKNGMLPCIRVGKKTLINCNTLVNYLFSEDLPVSDEPKPSEPSGNGIRKIPAKIKR